jgi:hypothetical protein
VKGRHGKNLGVFNSQSGPRTQWAETQAHGHFSYSVVGGVQSEEDSFRGWDCAARMVKTARSK